MSAQNKKSEQNKSVQNKSVQNKNNFRPDCPFTRDLFRIPQKLNAGVSKRPVLCLIISFLLRLRGYHSVGEYANEQVHHFLIVFVVLKRDIPWSMESALGTKRTLGKSKALHETGEG